MIRHYLRRMAYYLSLIYPRIMVRPMVQYVKGKFDYPLTGLEIGVFRGENSRNMLGYLPIDRLCGVDIIQKPRISDKKFFFYQGLSEEIYKQFKDGEFDFIYIDGDHSYEAVKKDIENYWPKLRKGGVFGGHDFEPYHNGVARAVLEFVAREGLELMGYASDWWVVK